jgi:cytochrome c553
MVKATAKRMAQVVAGRIAHPWRTVVPLVAFAVLPALALAAERPDWAFPPKQADQNLPVERDDGLPKQVPGSKLAFTQAQIDDRMNPPDWFPDEHPPLPAIVARGNGTTVRACMGCHLATGHGHPENSRLPGTTAGYLARQLADFRSGARSGAGTTLMVAIAKGLTGAEIRDSTEYFSGLKVFRWTRVVETDTVPQTYFKGTRRLQRPDGGTEPIGRRIIEVPENVDRVEHRDPHAGFVSYVPVGSLARGEALATAGAGKTVPCAICHGPGLKGLGDVPNIAGRSPGNIARQLYYIQTGERGGTSAALMKGVVEKLDGDDVIAISAYVASLEP